MRRLVIAYASAVALAALAGGGLALAQALPKLPDDGITLAMGADSPGQVRFNHSTHVDASKPECVSCHPKDHSILGAKGTPVPILHKNFEERRQCGRCHDGESAFAATDDCSFCHVAE
jgi:c(7)-type cytochrome triheme protein